jgi:uncharacterized damage-inducible protein DinB
MGQHQNSLHFIFGGWDGYNQSLGCAACSLTPAQLNWRPGEDLFSAGELVRHISLGRISWLLPMQAPGSQELAEKIPEWTVDRDDNRHILESAVDIVDQPQELVSWLQLTWQVINNCLAAWTVPDLAESYRYTWNGQVYANSRQWTLWRILNHDLHHGGELSLMLGLQGIQTFELQGLFGHIILPPLANEKTG